MIGMSFNAYGTVLRRVAIAEAIERDREEAASEYCRGLQIGSQIPGRPPIRTRTTTIIVAAPPMAMTLLGAA
jgi:hypothetical protein